MPKAAKKDQTKKNNSSSRKTRNGKAKPLANKNAVDEVPVEAGTTGTSASTAAGASEKKRKGRAATNELWHIDTTVIRLPTRADLAIPLPVIHLRM